MPMDKPGPDIDSFVYDARYTINGDIIYKVTKKNIFVESHVAQYRITPRKFWDEYAYTGKADEWFPHIDPSSITYRVSEGQDGMGSDVRAYGKLLGVSRELVEHVREAFIERGKILHDRMVINRQIKALEDAKPELPYMLALD